MLKAERVKLAKAVPALLVDLGGVPDVDNREWTFSGGRHGKVRVTFYNAQDAKDCPWLPCQLKDWGDGLPRAVRVPGGPMGPAEWHGFRHWKQNLYADNKGTAEAFLQRIREHLFQLGIDCAVVQVSQDS